jgi:hypothetical protein
LKLNAGEQVKRAELVEQFNTKAEQMKNLYRIGPFECTISEFDRPSLESKSLEKLISTILLQKIQTGSMTVSFESISNTCDTLRPGLWLNVTIFLIESLAGAILKTPDSLENLKLAFDMIPNDMKSAVAKRLYIAILFPLVVKCAKSRTNQSKSI